MGMTAETDEQVVRITVTSGAVDVTAEPGRTEVETRGGTVEQTASVTTVTSRSDRVRVRVPEGTDVVIGSTSGRVRVSGRVGAVSVITSSGSVRIDDASSVDVRSTSGVVRIGRVVDECRAAASSARVDVERCGTAHVTTRSGRVELRDVHGDAVVNCVSGRVAITMAGAHDVDAETVSGRIGVSLPAGVRPLVLSTPTDTGPDDGHDCVVLARSVSGRVDVTNR